MNIIALIPARLESSRLPGKALKKISGIPAIVHTFLRCQFSREISDIFVCTDSIEISDAISKVGGKTIMTGKHRNGSERIYEAASKLNCSNLINIQGDEILVNPDHVDEIARCMRNDNQNDFFLGHTNFNIPNDKSSFKSVLNVNDELIYCSREDIPSPSISKNSSFYKTVFIIGFKNNSLKKFVSWDECELENAEPNEFLRILYNANSIKSVFMSNAQISLDTDDDLKVLRRKIKSDNLFKKYEHSRKFF